MTEVIIENTTSEHKRLNSYWLSVSASNQENSVIGFIDARVIPGKKVAEIEGPMDSKDVIRHEADEDGFYITPSERNKGLGSALFEHLIQTLKKEGIEHLIVVQPTPESVEFYKKHGGKGEAYGTMYFDLRGQ